MSDDYRYLGFQFWSVIESVWQHLFTSAFNIWEPQRSGEPVLVRRRKFGGRLKPKNEVIE